MPVMLKTWFSSPWTAATLFSLLATINDSVAFVPAGEAPQQQRWSLPFKNTCIQVCKIDPRPSASTRSTSSSSRSKYRRCRPCWSTSATIGENLRRPNLGVGFDFGTSGVRVVVVDAEGREQFDSSLGWAAPDDPDEWLRAADTLLGEVPLHLRKRTSRVCFCGTSASCLLVCAHDPSRVTRGPRMYGCNTLTESPEAARKALQTLEGIAPEKHTTLSGTSALMKLVCWHLESPIKQDEAFCHQADYVSAHVRGVRGPGSMVSDWNNALKAGYDVERLRWPAWLLQSDLGRRLAHCLPQVEMPGAAVGPVSSTMSYRFSLPSSCQVVAGTTDSIAAFIAANATTPGHAVTSLGSTLAVKMLSERRVEDASRGVYSHRLGHAGRGRGGEGRSPTCEQEGGNGADLWLVGGASNVGCAVLRSEGFEPWELEALSLEIDPSTDSPLEYYPLARGKRGERFPTNDPLKESVLEPRPDGRKEYLHGLLQAIARVERDGYATLEALGATKLAKVDTAGGGAANPVWTAMRQRLLNVPTGRASNADAAYGSALLSMQDYFLGGAAASIEKRRSE